jgi:hypothetical protein
VSPVACDAGGEPAVVTSSYGAARAMPPLIPQAAHIAASSTRWIRTERIDLLIISSPFFSSHII